MNCIHTYSSVSGHDLVIDKIILLPMTLSCLLAKKHFKKVILYTTPNIANLIKDIGIPYDEIITEPLDGVTYKTFSVPKLITYSLQKEPFVHIDLDMFLFNIPKDITNYDVIYAYEDLPIKRYSNINSLRSLFDVYLKNLFEIEGRLDYEFKKNIDVFDIPNMSIFGGNNFKQISEASKICLDIYQNNKEFFDSDYIKACLIEQLFVPTAIRMLNNSSTKEKNYVYSNINNFRIREENQNLSTVNYPLEINFNHKNIILENETNLFNLVGFDFNYPIHLVGYKYLDAVLFIVKETIIKNFKDGELYINKIEEIYPKEENFDIISKRYKEYKCT